MRASDPAQAGTVPRRVFLAAAGGALLAACGSSSDDDDTGVPARQPDSSTPPSAGEYTTGGVVVVGDSLTEGAESELKSAIGEAGITTLRIDGATGRRIAVGESSGPPSGVVAVADAVDAELRPSVWVIALGTNDAAHYESDQFAAIISKLLQELPADGAAVAWVNVYLRDFPEQAAAFNAALQESVGERPFALVGDWADAAAEPGLVADDGVHLTRAGRTAFAEMVVDLLERLS